MSCPTCSEPVDDGVSYDSEWFFNEPVDANRVLRPQCHNPCSENETRSNCGVFIHAPEFIVHDLYNYNAKPQRAYHRLDHFKEVLGQFQGREGKTMPPEILHQIKDELRIVNEVTASDVKKAMRKLKLTKYIENLYFILFAVTGKQPPCVKRETKDKIIRTFKMLDRVWYTIEKDRRRSFLNYYFFLSLSFWTSWVNLILWFKFHF